MLLPPQVHLSSLLPLSSLWHCGLQPWPYLELLQPCCAQRSSTWSRMVIRPQCSACCNMYRCILVIVAIVYKFPSTSVSHQKSPSPPLHPPGIPPGDPTPSDVPTSSADPTSSHYPNTIQLQPNPSYCLLEMSHQQPKSSRLENEAKYVNL